MEGGQRSSGALLIISLVVSFSSCLITSTASASSSRAGEGIRTGEFEITSTLAELTSAESARVVEPVIAGDEPVVWEVYVPAGYRSEKPAGLMVYISPSPSGRIPRPWKPIMDKRNLIYLAANRSGNKVLPARRALFALVAPTLIRRHYEIDSARIYLSGLSGGGKMAGMVVAAYPQLFKGAIYNCGINPLGNHPPRQRELFKQNHSDGDPSHGAPESQRRGSGPGDRVPRLADRSGRAQQQASVISAPATLARIRELDPAKRRRA